MTFEKAAPEEEEQSVELSLIFSGIVKKWRVVLSGVIICALAGIIIAAATYVPQYTSTISYVINPKNTSTEITTNDFLVAENLANTYSRVIKGRAIIQRIKSETLLDEDISKYITTSLIDSSNIMEVRVRTPDADKSYAIAKALNEYLPEEARRVVQTGSLDVFETPIPAIRPDANDNLSKMALIGALLGFFVTCAAIALICVLKKSVATPEQITSKIDITHIGSVPHIGINSAKKSFGRRKKKPQKHEPMLITNKKTGFVFGETYKSMRTKIERYSKKHGCKTFLVTSALENEGKTTVAVNIAITLAQNGSRVMLLDCDLRKPAVATVLEMRDKVKSETIDVISGKVSHANAVIHCERPSFDFIGGIKSLDNSSEALSKDGTKKMMDALREEYDYVIVDTPPSLLFTDSSVLAEIADASILVVRQNTANIDDIINVANDLSQTKADLMGFVFNNVDDMSVLPSGYSKRYGYYGYSKN